VKSQIMDHHEGFMP